MTEFKFDNVTVRIHGKEPDREKLEQACIRFISKAERGSNGIIRTSERRSKADRTA